MEFETMGQTNNQTISQIVQIKEYINEVLSESQEKQKIIDYLNKVIEALEK